MWIEKKAFKFTNLPYLCMVHLDKLSEKNSLSTNSTCGIMSFYLCLSCCDGKQLIP